MTEHATLTDLYLDQLRDLYSAERQILDVLPEMESAAKGTGLRNVFRTHYQETQGHVNRLDQIFRSMNAKPTGEKCDAIEGILKEGKKELKHWRDGPANLLDAALIAGAQRVEHYEMAAYGTARTLAERLNRSTDASLLQDTLNEEKHADRVLTDVASSTLPAATRPGARPEQTMAPPT